MQFSAVKVKAVQTGDKAVWRKGHIVQLQSVVLLQSYCSIMQCYCSVVLCTVIAVLCSVIVQSAVLLRLITLGIRLAEADEMGVIGRLSAARVSPSSSFNLGRFFSELYRVVFLTDPP